MKETEIIRICKDHQEEFQAPLIWTFAFIGAEYWCPYCGRKEGMLGAGEKVKSTSVLRNRLRKFRELSEDFLDANCAQVCISMEWKGKTITYDQLPQEEKDKKQKAINDWKYGQKPL